MSLRSPSGSRCLDRTLTTSDTDADAHDNANVQPLDHRIFVGLDDAHGGRRIDDWSVLPSEFDALPQGCPP